MPDTLTPEQRKLCMSSVKGVDTGPELLIRKVLFKKGFRYILHDKRLPGKPDLVFPKYHSIIFIHGCFWHQHDCQAFSWPKTNKQFWRKKLNRNRELDQKNFQKLQNEGWYILTIWECALKGKGRKPFDKLIDQISDWLVYGTRNLEIRGRR